MNWGSKTPIIPLFEDPESEYHKKMKTKLREASKRTLEREFESFEMTPNKKESGYEPKSKQESDKLIETESEPKTTWQTLPTWRCMRSRDGCVKTTDWELCNPQFPTHLALSWKDISFLKWNTYPSMGKTMRMPKSILRRSTTSLTTSTYQTYHLRHFW